jgi:inhibitor of cysteine peptidase
MSNIGEWIFGFALGDCGPKRGHEMKKSMLTWTMLTLLPWLTACASPVTVAVSCDEFYETPHVSQAVEVGRGDAFTITLCANPSTGFQWEEAEISDSAVLQQVDRQYEPPGGRKPAPGSAGQETWTFKALQPGQSAISIDYSRPWEGGEKAEWTFVLNVAVK